MTGGMRWPGDVIDFAVFKRGESSRVMEGELWQEPAGHCTRLSASTLVGRSPEADIQLSSARVSREHCMLRRQGNGYWLYDLGSANGTLLNDREVVQPTQVKHGDVISVADVTFRFMVPGEIGPPGGGDPSEGEITMMSIRKNPIIILVTDIVGYSGLSAKLAEEDLATVINAWYEDCGRVMERRGGVIDKFIGDAMFGYWKSTSPIQRIEALAAAKELVAPRHWTSEAGRILADHDLVVRCGAGLHIGEAAIGSVARGARTALGDAVNIAFRIESMTRPLGRPVLASEAYFSGWDAGLSSAESCGRHALKGYTGEYELFAVK